jgi:hypothetical protein
LDNGGVVQAKEMGQIVAEDYGGVGVEYCLMPGDAGSGLLFAKGMRKHKPKIGTQTVTLSRERGQSGVKQEVM